MEMLWVAIDSMAMIGAGRKLMGETLLMDTTVFGTL
jgi:hypothetical protein